MDRPVAPAACPRFDRVPPAFPLQLLAQASIAGVVKDASGAVLPGVTVEAASPVLIEKTRSVAPTVPAVPHRRPAARHLHRDFTLPGFKHREARGDRADRPFVATVNADLRVGELTETVTVTGESPIVDVQSATQQRVITEEVIEAIPAGRSHRTWRCWCPGSRPAPASAQTSGRRRHQQPAAANASRSTAAAQRHGVADRRHPDPQHGHGATDQLVPGHGQRAGNDDRLRGRRAEQPSGGVRVNFIPREGGNLFTRPSSRPGELRRSRATTTRTS